MIVAVIPTGRHHPAVLGVEIALLRPGNRVLIPGMAPVDGITKRILGDEYFLVLPILVVRAPEKNPHPQVNPHEVRRDEFSVYDDSGGDKHFSAPIRHLPVIKIAVLRILKTSPAAEHDPPLSHLLIAR